MKRRGKNKYNKGYKSNRDMKKLVAILIGVIMILSLVPYFLMVY